ncbi:MAG: hypothetical protein ACFFCD_01795 [Promethearchaeota archaeon]
MEFDPRAIVIRLNAIGNAMDELANDMHRKRMEKTMQTCDILLHLIDVFWEYYTLNARFFPEEVYVQFRRKIVKILEEIYIGLSAFQSSTLSPETTSSLLVKYNNAFQNTQKQLFLNEAFNSAEKLEHSHNLDPRVKNDRIMALLEGYDAKKGDCPYYTPETKSKCLLEPRAIKVIDCEGRCFINGLCCQMIAENVGTISNHD